MEQDRTGLKMATFNGGAQSGRKLQHPQQPRYWSEKYLEGAKKKKNWTKKLDQKVGPKNTDQEIGPLPRWPLLTVEQNWTTFKVATFDGEKNGPLSQSGHIPCVISQGGLF